MQGKESQPLNEHLWEFHSQEQNTRNHTNILPWTNRTETPPHVSTGNILNGSLDFIGNKRTQPLQAIYDLSPYIQSF